MIDLAQRRRSGPPGVGLTAIVSLVAAVTTSAAILFSPLLAVAGLVGVITVIAIVEEPSLGALVVAAFAILRLSEVATEFYGAPTTFTPVLGLIGVALAARAIHTGRIPTGGGRAAAVVAALAAVALISLATASHLSVGIGAVVSLLKDGAIAVVIGILVHSARTLRQIVWVLIWGGAFLSVLSLLQFLLGAYGSSFGGFAQSKLQHVVGTTDEIRISGPVGDPNFYAQWLVMLIPLAVDRFRDETSPLLRLVAASTTVTCTAVIVVTFSRGALLGLAIVGTLMLLRHPPRPATIAAALAVAVIALPFLPSGYVDRMAALADIGGVDIGTDPSLRAREVEVAVATEMFFEDPLTGIGYGTYQDNYVDYARGLGVEQKVKPREAHNLYLETAAETGIPGLVVLGASILAAAMSLSEGRRIFRDIGDHRSDGIGHAVGVALIGYLATSVFLHLAFARPMWLLLGLALAFPSLARSEVASHDEAATV